MTAGVLPLTHDSRAVLSAPTTLQWIAVKGTYRSAVERLDAERRELVGEPDDVDYAILYLVSDAARFTTGQVLRPNGGQAMP